MRQNTSSQAAGAICAPAGSDPPQSCGATASWAHAGRQPGRRAHGRARRLAAGRVLRAVSCCRRRPEPGAPVWGLAESKAAPRSGAGGERALFYSRRPGRTALVRLNRLAVEGLFSYAARQEVEFSDRTVIVGPNNSGKSNLFRAIGTIADALLRDRGLPPSGNLPAGRQSAHRGGLVPVARRDRRDGRLFLLQARGRGGFPGQDDLRAQRGKAQGPHRRHHDKDRMEEDNRTDRSAAPTPKCCSRRAGLG